LPRVEEQPSHLDLHPNPVAVPESFRKRTDQRLDAAVRDATTDPAASVRPFNFQVSGGPEGPYVGKGRLTCGSGPKGIRTPDLLAASQTGLNAVLTCGNAGQRGAERAKSWGVARLPPRPGGEVASADLRNGDTELGEPICRQGLRGSPAFSPK
jgi:hypothetical protein